MEDGTASRTARSVAAHRLEYERAAADYGDPAADQALTADVADGQQPNPGRMHEYLRARTAFFDRAVVNALDRGVRQVVIGGAGYDGRALRYAKPGVAWFELDHPATQADKVERVARLGLERGHVRFIAADFTADPIAEPLLAAGLDPARPTLFLLEGVAVYLERPVVERVLAAFREVAADGSELAMSVSTGTSTPEQRARFQQRVAALRRARPLAVHPRRGPRPPRGGRAGSRARPPSASWPSASCSPTPPRDVMPRGLAALEPYPGDRRPRPGGPRPATTSRRAAGDQRRTLDPVAAMVRKVRDKGGRCGDEPDWGTAVSRRYHHASWQGTGGRLRRGHRGGPGRRPRNSRPARRRSAQRTPDPQTPAPASGHRGLT